MPDNLQSDHRADSGQPPTANRQPLLRWLGRVEYEPTWRAMQAFTEARTAQTPDQIWFLEHPPVTRTRARR